MTKEEFEKTTKKDWVKMFTDFVNGLLKITDEMNQEMFSLLLIAERDEDCGETIAKVTQVDKDLKKILDYIEGFQEERSLKVTQ